jgi:8-oxo-dGTP diphosphatase
VAIDSKHWPQVGVGVAVWRGDEVLLVKRGTEPWKGQWSLPGGRQQPRETVREAAIREVIEETGLTVTPATLIDVVDSITYSQDGCIQYHYTLVDFGAEWQAGDACAGDDAVDVCWMRLDELDGLDMWDETRRIVRLSFSQRAEGLG